MAARVFKTGPGLLFPRPRPTVDWRSLWCPEGGAACPVPAGARQKSVIAPSSMKAMRKRQAKKNAAKSPSQGNEATIKSSWNDSRFMQNILPATVVRPPLSEFPRSPRKLARFVWVLAKQWVLDFAGRALFQMSTMPSFWRPPALKLRRKRIVPTAKALHSTMSEALARGDAAALRAICCEPLAARLGAIIQSRPRGKRYGWELVRYGSPSSSIFSFFSRRSPRLASDKIALLGVDMPVRQAVVSIASRQRRVEYDDSPSGRGRVVPGSEREADLVEYVVLVATINPNTHQQNEWRLLSTIKPTTLEKFEAETAAMAEAEEAENNKYKI